MQLPILAVATLSDSVPHLIGFAIVLVVLIGLWVLTDVIGMILPKPKAAVAKTAQPVAAAPQAAAAAPAASDETDEMAVIAAVVAMLLDERAHRIVSIRQRGTDWSREGRRQHHASHRIR
ncbi:MAG: sodium pump decarboxylase subunit gamma [Puniceicoccaceae bacterium 5H]|nr:MAG: sodium pump decarboxylase subunit gamma [Puniceicoccaceae bacterium 5H]